MKEPKKQRPRKQRSIAILGPGNWGASLAAALRGAGVPLLEIIDARSHGPTHELPAIRRRERVQAIPLGEASLAADVWWVCVPDAAIGEVVSALVERATSLRRGFKDRLVIHSSGALGNDVLDPARLAGAAVASIHPMMSFPSRDPVSLQGVAFGIEGDAAVQRKLRPLIHQLGGRAFTVPAGNKALYHAIGMLASPLLVSHLAAAMQVAEAAGLSNREAAALIQPIADATMNNFFHKGAAGSFSGPIARGDEATIRLHLQVLESHPMLLDVYRALARFAVKALPSAAGSKLARLFGEES